MPDQNPSPKTLSEALEQLESVTQGKTSNSMNEDLQNLKRAIEDLKPHLKKISSDVTQAAGDAFNGVSKEVEEKVQKHPWYALGIVGLIAFLIGFLLGRKD